MEDSTEELKYYMVNNKNLVNQYFNYCKLSGRIPSFSDFTATVGWNVSGYVYSSQKLTNFLKSLYRQYLAGN